MFSFHKPKIYRSISGCCICRAKSSSSRFTDSKKYETEFEKCFRIAEKRTGEICNACVLLVKRWKKLPTGTNRNWHHVVDARAGPGTKSFKNKSCGDKKRSFGKPTRNISPLDSKVRHQSMTSSESESEEEDDEMMDDLDSLVEAPNHSNSHRSLRRSNRITVTSPASKRHYKKTSGSVTDRNNNLNGIKNGLAKRRSLKPEHFFSFLDTSFWQKEKVCCGIIFKGPNNEVIIYPELLSPCGCRKQTQTFSLTSTSQSSSSSECESVSRSSSSNSLSVSKPPALISVSVSPNGAIFSSPGSNTNISLTQVKSLTEPTLSLATKKPLCHQDSFTNSDTSSEPGSITHEDTDDQSSGVSSMAACDESTMMVPDCDLSSALSDRLSTVSSVCLLTDVDDASSNASTATYDGLSHHELEMSSEDSPVKTAPDSGTHSLANNSASAVFTATAVV